jgi:hypothetical protein
VPVPTQRNSLDENDQLRAGRTRARAKIGLQNLAYNIRRLVTLERLAAA